MRLLTVDEAFEICRQRARAHYENFPVGLFVPRDKQPYVHALYAFARSADDFADEPHYEGMRREKLDEWERRLHAAYEGRAEDPIFIALAETVRRLDVPKGLLLDLLSAFRQDTEKQRYDTWDELLDYCRRSAGWRRSRTRSAPASSSRTTGRTSRSTSHAAACTCPASCSIASPSRSGT